MCSCDWPAIGSDEAYDRSVGIFDCQTQLWRSGPRVPIGQGDAVAQMFGAPGLDKAE